MDMAEALKEFPWLRIEDIENEAEDSDQEEEPKSEDYDTDLEKEDNSYLLKGEPEYVYKAACKRYKLTPITHILTNLALRSIELNNHGLSEEDVMALSLALVNNTTVVRVELSGNNIGCTGMKYIAQMLDENEYIKQIDVSHNPLCTSGAKVLCKMLRSNETLKYLNASGGEFRESDAHYFAEALQENNTLTHLNLSHNEFCEIGGMVLGQTLAVNMGIENLDLSWNHLRLRGALAMAEGLMENRSLLRLNLSWNGFADEGAKAISKAFIYNKFIKEVDLTCNRINRDGTMSLAEALKQNLSLQLLKLSKNPITTQGACQILRVFQMSPNSRLQRLELLDIEVSPEFDKLLDEIHASQRPLEVVHGGYVRHGDPYAKRGERKTAVLGDPMALLMEYVKASNLRLWDLFAQFDKDNSLSVSRLEFKKGMRDAKVPLTDDQIEKLMDRLDRDKNGEISFEELLDGQKRYRERERKKYEQMLPSVLRRPRSSKLTIKDPNLSVMRTKTAKHINMSMSLTVPSMNTM